MMIPFDQDVFFLGLFALTLISFVVGFGWGRAITREANIRLIDEALARLDAMEARVNEEVEKRGQDDAG